MISCIDIVPYTTNCATFCATFVALVAHSFCATLCGTYFLYLYWFPPMHPKLCHILCHICATNVAQSFICATLCGTYFLCWFHPMHFPVIWADVELYNIWITTRFPKDHTPQVRPDFVSTVNLCVFLIYFKIYNLQYAIYNNKLRIN